VPPPYNMRRNPPSVAPSVTRERIMKHGIGAVIALAGLAGALTWETRVAQADRRTRP